MRARRWCRSLVACSLALGLIGAPGGSPASALPLADFHLVAAQRLYDSRQPGAALTEGVPIALTWGQPTIVNMQVVSATRPTWFYLHPCGQPVDRSQPAAVFAEPGDDETNLVRVHGLRGCLTMFGDADLVIDWVGYESPDPGGADYVGLIDPVELPTTTSGTDIVVPLDDGVPAQATLVALSIEVSAPAGPVIAIGPCDTSLGQVLAVPPGGFASNLFILPVRADGTVCLRTLGGSPESIDVLRWGYFAPNAEATQVGLPYRGWVEEVQPGYVSLTPERLFDTREIAPGAPLPDGGTFRYRFDALPAEATAVALNITATGTSGPGYVSAYPCDVASRPLVSNVNFTGANQTVPNFAIVALGAAAEICFDVLRSTHLLADISGYYVAGGGDGYIPVVPDRVFDTRDAGTPVIGGTVYATDLTGSVADDASAVVLNVTATQTADAGFLTVFPCGEVIPEASNVNYAAAESRPNLVTVKLPPDRRVCVFSRATSHVLADIAGYYSPSSDVGLVTVEPFRVFDTREPADGPQLGPGEEVGFSFPSDALQALAWNLTVTETTGPGFVTGYPCENGRPEASNVNYAGPGQTTANFALLRPDTAGDLCFASLAGTHLIADEFGFFVSPLPTAVLDQTAQI